MPFPLKPKIAHLILAAGSSSRMEEPKQLLPWGDTTLIGHAIQQSLALEEVTTYVILGAYFDLINMQINHFPIEILKNSDWQSGMGSSISSGVKTIMKDKVTYNAALITVVDQPLIDTVHLNALLTEFKKTPNDIVATDLGERVGVPAIIPKKYFEELSQLKADHGARYIIAAYKNEVKTITALDKGVDIDTVEQYETLFQSKFPS